MNILFDFETFPDSAGCSDPSDIHTCDPEWQDGYEHGILEEHVHTISGLTLTLDAQGSPLDWGWDGGIINCGNTSDCAPFRARFDQDLVYAEVELLGLQDYGGGGDEQMPWLYYAEGYDAAGTQLIRLESSRPGGFAFDAPENAVYRELRFGVASAGGSENLGQVGSLRVETVDVPVPEPSAALLLALGIAAVARCLRGAQR